MSAMLQHKQLKRYRSKYKYLKKRIKGLILENAALCDEVAKIQESILIVKDERKFLLRKLLEYEKDTDFSQSYHRNETAITNGSKSRVKRKQITDVTKTVPPITHNNS